MNKDNKELTKKNIDFILAFRDKLKKEIEDFDSGRETDLNIAGGYVTDTMLNCLYSVLVGEGYSRKYLNKFFFNDDYPDCNTYKEWLEKSFKFYHIDLRKKLIRQIDDLPDHLDKNKKMMVPAINHILEFSKKFRKAKENKEYDEEYIIVTMLSFAHTILLKEKYSPEHLNEIFYLNFYDYEYPDIEYQTYGEWRKHIAREYSENIVEKFYNEDPVGRKLKRLINKLSKKFNR